jgi:CRISPR-associated protein Cas5d
MPRTSRSFRVKVWGDYGCFTRPEMKVERVSYPIMTPAAARGVIESILWKPQLTWRINRIDRLRPPVFQQVRRNEVGSKASPDRPAILIESVRQQRATLLLRDVAYTIHATLCLSARAGHDDTLLKYAAMFGRRARRGQCFQHPCLGSREFAADFALIGADEPDPTPEQALPMEELGWIFHDFDWSRSVPCPRFFQARLENGRMMVPPLPTTGSRP